MFIVKIYVFSYVPIGHMILSPLQRELLDMVAFVGGYLVEFQTGSVSDL